MIDVPSAHPEAIERLLPERCQMTASELVGELAAALELRPFARVSLSFWSAVSDAIMASPRARALPVVMATGQWLRRRHLESLVEAFRERAASGAEVVPRGLAFHVAPANAETLFVYGWALSQLAGNRNVVRVSERGGDEQKLLLDVVGETLQAPEFEAIAAGNAVVRYPRERGAASEAFALGADLRVFWGGDETVRALRALPSRTHATELSFVDKRSLAVLSARAIAEADEGELLELARRFYNDAYVFAQMACSSPHHVVFVGSTEEVARARARWWPAVEREVHRRGARTDPSVNMGRLQHAFELAADGVSFAEVPALAASSPVVIRTDDVDALASQRSCGDGFFLELAVDRVAELAPHLRRDHQTLTHHGIDGDALRTLVCAVGSRGLDRVVPLGQALAFGPVWDGEDLLARMTRMVVVSA